MEQVTFSDLITDLDEMTDHETEAVIMITVTGHRIEVSTRGDWQLISDALEAALDRHRSS